LKLMGKILQSKYYDLLECVGSNSLTQSWIARNNMSGQKCFLKISSEDYQNKSETVFSTLNLSYKLQKKIRNDRILRAVTKRVEDGRLIIEYPYLEPADWKIITLSTFLDNSQPILIQMCLIIDFLHLMGYVHADLKVENFLINTSAENKNVILVDLDFLMVDNSPRIKTFAFDLAILFIVPNRSIIVSF